MSAAALVPWDAVLPALTAGAGALCGWAGRFAWTRRRSTEDAAGDALRPRFVDPDLDPDLDRDRLTGLADRHAFERRVAAAAARLDAAHAGAGPGPAASRLALLFVDIDGFRPLNDSLGHAQGDALLAETARRLVPLLHGDEAAGRVGADEFALLLRVDGGVIDAIARAERVLFALAQPFDVGGRVVTLSASIGVSLYPDDGAAARLLAHADLAKSAAQRAGGNCFATYRAQMDVEADDEVALQHDLRHAIAAGELELHYQPKVAATDGALLGVEALLRWRHPARGWISPARFIPVAERYGLIGSIGDWVVEAACRQMAQWAREGWPLPVAINVSVHQLRQPGLAERISAALSKHGVPPGRLMCEITETAAMSELRDGEAAVDALARAGVFLSIDDFGTGYSSLAYLRRLPARELKIDRSFVADLVLDADARAIVHAVLELAHALGLKVVAEGVETECQRQTLAALGCDALQGYAIARPMDAAALAAWQAARRSPGREAGRDPGREAGPDAGRDVPKRPACGRGQAAASASATQSSRS